MSVAAASLAATTALASEPLGWTWVQWLAMIPFLRALDGLDRRRSFAVGWAAGVGANVALFTWLAPATAAYGGLPEWVSWIAFAAYVAGNGLPLGALGLADALVRARRPWLRPALFPLLLVAVELGWPQLFGWTVGSPQVLALPVAQVAELGGPLLLSGLVAAVNAGLDVPVAWWLAGRRPGGRGGPFPWRAPALAAGLLLATLSYGVIRLAQVRDDCARARFAAVALAQPGLHPAAARDLPAGTLRVALEACARDVAAAGPVALALFPEGTCETAHLDLVPPPQGAPAPAWRLLELGRAEAERGERERAALGRLAGCPVLVGANHYRAEPDATGLSWRVLERRTALLLVGPDGAERARYDKHLLLPLAEFLPGEDTLPWLRRVVPLAGQFSAGPGPRLLEVGDLRVVPLVCYEAVFPSAVRGTFDGQEGPDVLVNATNDAWFGGQGPGLHRMMTRLRAIESRRALLRATTTGLTCVVLPDGSCRDELPPGRGVVVARVPVPADRAARSPYVLLGDAWAVLGALVAGAAIAAPRRAEPVTRG